MNGIAATTFASGRLDMFYLDSKFAMKQRSFAAGASLGPPTLVSLGGAFTTVPVAVATMAHRALTVEQSTAQTRATTPAVATAPTAPSPALAPLIARTAGAGMGGALTATQPRLDMFGIGPDYAMYHKGRWGAAADDLGSWDSLGGAFTSSPSVLALDGHIHVFGLGTDYSLLHRLFDGTTWSAAWEKLGGAFSSAATVVSWGPGHFDVFARGSDFTLRHRSFDNNTWSSDWQNLGESLASPPVAVSWGPNRLDVFAISNTDGAVIHRWWDGMIWNDWERVVGTKDLTFTSMPAAATWGPNRLDVFAVGADSVLYHVFQTDDAWSQPESLLGGISSSPTVVVQGVNSLMVMAPGNDPKSPPPPNSHNIYFSQWNNGWKPGGFSQFNDQLRLPSLYRFSVDLVVVNTTRSLNSDTDTGQVTLAVGNWPTTLTAKNWPYLSKTQSMGDLGGADVKEGYTNLLNFGPVTVELCESSIFNYTVVNTQATPDVVSAFLSKQGVSLADSGIKTIVKDIGAGIGITSIEVAEATSIPLIGSLIAILSSWLFDQLNSVLSARCDGTVAVEQVVLMGRDLQQKTKSKFATKTIHQGTDSATGCGPHNSNYTVSWSITQL